MILIGILCLWLLVLCIFVKSVSKQLNEHIKTLIYLATESTSVCDTDAGPPREFVRKADVVEDEDEEESASNSRRNARAPPFP